MQLSSTSSFRKTHSQWHNRAAKCIIWVVVGLPNCQWRLHVDLKDVIKSIHDFRIRLFHYVMYWFILMKRKSMVTAIGTLRSNSGSLCASMRLIAFRCTYKWTQTHISRIWNPQPTENHKRLCLICTTKCNNTVVEYGRCFAVSSNWRVFVQF